MMKIKSLPRWHRSFCRARVECLFSESDAVLLKQARESCQFLQVYEMLVEQREEKIKRWMECPVPKSAMRDTVMAIFQPEELIPASQCH